MTRKAKARAPRRGEIWQVDRSPGRGSEQAGHRPAVVIQNDAGNGAGGYPNTIVLAVSTSGRDIPFHVRVTPGPGNGLRQESWVKCEQILTVAKARLLEPPLGRLSPEELRRVEDAILVSLGIDR